MEKFARVRRVWTDAVNFVGGIYQGSINGSTLSQISDRIGIPYWNLQKRARRVFDRCDPDLICMVRRGNRNLYKPLRRLTPHQARKIQKKLTPKKFS